MPGKWRATVRIGPRKLGAEPARLSLAGFRAATAQPNDVVDWSHQMGRQLDVDDLGEVA